MPVRYDLSAEQREILDYGPLEPIARHTVNVVKITTRWPGMLRVAGSLVTNQIRPRRHGRGGVGDFHGKLTAAAGRGRWR